MNVININMFVKLTKIKQRITCIIILIWLEHIHIY